MRKTVTRGQELSRRALIFGGLQAAVFSTLLGRLYYLQFIKSGEFKTLSENNRIKLQLIPPARGFILDCNGLPLAQNQKNYRLLLEAEYAREQEDIVTEIARYIELSPERIAQIAAEARKLRQGPPIVVREHLSWDELSRLEFHSPELPGVSIDISQVRHYPLADKASHLIGYVSSVSEEDLGDEDQPLLKLPSFRIGKNGVEKMLDVPLRGVAGVQHIEVNVHGFAVRELSRKESTAGKNIHLTIDSRLQAFAAERMGEESGSVVVVDISNGDVLALVSTPAYDPNRFGLGIPTDYWKELHDNPRHPLINKAIAGQYPPGSTFKMLVGLAGLEAGFVTPGYRVNCPGHFFLGNHRFNCWKPEGHGTVGLKEAIAQSCDTFFYTVSQKAGIDRIADVARRFGLGVSHDLGLFGEKNGIIPDEEWKRARLGQPWQTGDTINAGIGQGFVLATPLQLAVMAARLASPAVRVAPRLVHPQELGATERHFEALKADPHHLELIREGMEAVTGSQSGTAYARRIMEPRFAMAGKTGTSQVKRITVRGRKQESLPWKDRHHALFVGYAPVHEPRYAVSVLVEHGGGGSAAAAPIARDVLLKMQQLAEEDAAKTSPVSGEEGAQDTMGSPP